MTDCADKCAGCKSSCKKMITVLKWPNGFYQLVQVLDEGSGALLEQEVNLIVDDLCTSSGVLRSDVQIRVFNTANVEIKDKL